MIAQALAATFRSLRHVTNPLPLTHHSLLDLLGGGPTKAGIRVSPESSLSYSAVWAGVNILAGAVGVLPFEVFRKIEGGREKEEDHPVAVMLEDPNPLETGQMFLERMMVNVLLWGNAYALIILDKTTLQAVGLVPLDPASIGNIEEDTDGSVFYIHQSMGRIPAEFIFHISALVKGAGLGALFGISPIKTNREAIALGLAAERFGAAFYGNMSQPGLILTHPTRIKHDSTVQRLKRQIDQKGSSNEAFGSLIIEEGMKVQSFGVDPDKGQFLETRRFQVLEVARILQLPPHMLMELERAHHSNVAEQGIEFLTYSLSRWLNRFEREARRKLLGPQRHSHVLKLNSRSLSRGDPKAEAAWLAALVDRGIMTINEARNFRDLNPIPGGDVPRVPLNFAPLGPDGQALGGDQDSDNIADINEPGEEGEQNSKDDSIPPAPPLTPLLRAGGRAKETDLPSVSLPGEGREGASPAPQEDPGSPASPPSNGAEMALDWVAEVCQRHATREKDRLGRRSRKMFQTGSDPAAVLEKVLEALVPLLRCDLGAPMLHLDPTWDVTKGGVLEDLLAFYQVQLRSDFHPAFADATRSRGLRTFEDILQRRRETLPEEIVQWIRNRIDLSTSQRTGELTPAA